MSARGGGELAAAIALAWVVIPGLQLWLMLHLARMREECRTLAHRVSELERERARVLGVLVGLRRAVDRVVSDAEWLEIQTEQRARRRHER